MFKPEGVYAAMLTPFGKDGRPDIKTVRAMVGFMAAKGADGVFPVSNAGEHIQLDDNDKKLIVEAVIDAAAGKIKVTPGLSAAGTEANIRLGRYFADAGADAVVVSAPHYFKYPQEVVYGHLSAVIRGLDMPVILYNNELFANAVTPETLERLTVFDNVVAVKDSSGKIGDLLAFIEASKGKRDFSVLAGFDELFVPALCVGAVGCMVVSGCFLPEVLAAAYRFAKEGRWDEAAEAQRIIARTTYHMKKLFFPYGYKTGIRARGFDPGPFMVSFDESVYAPECTAIENAVNAALADLDTLLKTTGPI